MAHPSMALSAKARQRPEDGKSIIVVTQDLESHSCWGGAQADEELVELSNGCICCTMRGDLLREVTRLARGGAFDYLLIESTGVSEPMQARARCPSQNVSLPHLIGVLVPCMWPLLQVYIKITLVLCPHWNPRGRHRQAWQGHQLMDHRL